MELLEKHNLDVPVRRIGISDAFVAHGPRKELLRSCGLDKDSIKETIREFVALPLG